VQLGILFLFFAANAWGWTVLTGDLSSSRLFDRITLADPLAVLQLLLAGGAVGPIGAAARGVAFGMGMGWALLLAIFLFDLFVVRHGYCGHICPLGAFYSLISRFRVVRVRHVKDNCTLCGACFAACPETHVLSLVGKHDGTVNNPECTNCFRCVEVCDDDALFVSLTGGWSE